MRTSTQPFTLAVVGAGPGVAALHLPTLARVPELFRVSVIADGGSGRGIDLADRVGARYLPDAAMLADERGLDAVLIASPPAQHAAHVRVALAAGVRGILCEKPLATTAADARDIVDECRRRGVALVVGTNHLFDPAWERTTHHLVASGERVASIRVALSLAPNPRYHRLVTENLVPSAGPPAGPPPVAAHAGIVRQLLTGLAIHDLPAVRDLAPAPPQLRYARFVAPVGYAVGYEAAGVEVQLSAVMREDGADTRWRMSVSTERDTVDIDFPPPFVHAGSAAVQVRERDGRRTAYPREADDGYDREWRALAAGMRGESAIEYGALLDDIEYVLALADAAAELVAGGAA